MAPLYYDILHVIGVMFLFAGFGALFSEGSRKHAMMLHGLGLVILLVAGFGMLAKYKFSYTSHWVIAKIVIWVILGALPVLAKRRVLPMGAVMAIALALGAAAAYLGFMKDAAF